jgi:hypothetical protein
MRTDIDLAPTITPSAQPAPPTPVRRRRPWLAITAVVAGALLLLSAGLWRSVAADALVRFPTDVDLHPRYEGTLTTFVDPATSAPLAAPLVVDLAVDRSVQAIADESTDDTVLVREAIRFSVDGADPSEQIHQFVMDRRSNANVADQRAWAFQPSNVLDRSGAYWVALPMGSEGDTAVAMFKDEIGTTFEAAGAGVTEEVAGLRLVAYDASATNAPVTPAYLDALAATVALPGSLTFEQLKPSLVAAGVPVDDALAALVRLATPEDLQSLVASTSQPIALEYVDSFSGRTFIEPDTGAVVDVRSVVERVGVRPAPEALPPLLAILERYRSDPAVDEAVVRLEALATEPMPVFEYRYAQVPSSVDEIATWVGDQRDRMVLAERTIPLVLAVAGGLLLLVGVSGLIVRARRQAR